MTRVYSRLFIWLWYSRLFGKGKTTSVSTMIKWWGIGDAGLGTMERISVWLPQLDTSPSALSTDPLNNMASTSSHFQGTGYGKSSSSARIIFILVPLCASRCSTICSSVVHSLLFGITLTPSNHLILGLPLFRIFPSSFFLRSAPLFSPYARTSSAYYLGLPLRFLPLSVSRSCIFHSVSCRPL